MIMNRLESLVVRSRARAWLLRRHEATEVLGGLALPAGTSCLEIGCGSGVGAMLIAKALRPSRVAAVDLDPGMIDSARRAIARPPWWARGVDTSVIRPEVGDSNELRFADGEFDAAFLFGVLHHIDGWPRTIRQVYRVLRPGGVFSFDEALMRGDRKRMNDWFGHVPFDRTELETELRAAGFEIRSVKHMGWLPTVFVRAYKPAGTI